MYPTLFTTPNGVGVHTYGLFILLAFCSAFLLVHLRAPKVGIDPDRLIPTYAAAGLGGMVGARLLYAFAVEPAETLQHPASLFSMSGFSFYGGVIGGFFAVLAVARSQQVDAWKLADIAAPAVLLGLGVGRMGCLFAGCCHGAPAPLGGTPLLPEGLVHGQFNLLTTPPFLTATFHDGVGRIHDVPLYPTQLWSVVAGLGLTALCVLGWRYRRYDGQVAALALFLEPPTRALIESFRADERGYSVTFEAPLWLVQNLPGLARAGSEVDLAGGSTLVGLTTAQTIAIGMMVVAVAIVLTRRGRGVGAEIPITMDEAGA